jgi:hypothetical protein
LRAQFERQSHFDEELQTLIKKKEIAIMQEDYEEASRLKQSIKERELVVN